MLQRGSLLIQRGFRLARRCVNARRQFAPFAFARQKFAGSGGAAQRDQAVGMQHFAAARGDAITAGQPGAQDFGVGQCIGQTTCWSSVSSAGRSSALHLIGSVASFSPSGSCGAMRAVQRAAAFAAVQPRSEGQAAPRIRRHGHRDRIGARAACGAASSGSSETRPLLPPSKSRTSGTMPATTRRRWPRGACPGPAPLRWRVPRPDPPRSSVASTPRTPGSCAFITARVPASKPPSAARTSDSTA